MDVFSGFKCIACLLKTVKILHCVKKALCVVIVVTTAVIALSGVIQNKDEIFKIFKHLKKKVM